MSYHDDSADYSEDSDQFSSPVASAPVASMPSNRVLPRRDSTAPIHSGMMIAGKWILDEPVGQGGYSVVWSAKGKDGSKCAIKLMNTEDRDVYLHEVKVLNDLRSCTITPLLGAGEAPGYNWLVFTQYAGSLEDLLMNRDGHALTTVSIQKIYKELFIALKEIHGYGYIHRDIKEGNLLLTNPYGDLDKMQLKVADFGLAHRYVDESGQIIPCKMDHPFHELDYSSVSAIKHLPYEPVDDFIMASYMGWMLNGLSLDSFYGDAGKALKISLIVEPSRILPAKLMWMLPLFLALADSYTNKILDYDAVTEAVEDMLRDTDGQECLKLTEDAYGAQLI